MKQTLALLTAGALAFGLAGPTLAQVALDADTAEALTALGIDPSTVTDEADLGPIKAILAGDESSATQTEQIKRIIDEN